MDAAFHILLVEDNPSDAGLIQASLRLGLGPVQVTRVDRLASAMDALVSARFDSVLLDLNLPDSSGLETFRQLAVTSNGTPVVVLSGVDDSETAIEAVAAGAADYVQKNNYDADILARSVRFAIERSARRATERELMAMRSELRVAQNIQDRLYPKSAPLIAGFEIGSGIRSAGIGCGDYFDFVELADGRILIVVGDVAGHGMGPAIVMAEARACLRTLVHMGADTQLFMPTMNRMIHASTSEGMFVTLMMVILDPKTGSFQYVNAGHPGWLIQQDQTQRLTTHQIPLGMLEDADYSQSDTLSLRPGEILVVPTDGVTETQRDGEMLGAERLIRCVVDHRRLSADEIVEAVFAAIVDFSGSSEIADDMTLVVLKAV